jgi:hypothetical protein
MRKGGSRSSTAVILIIASAEAGRNDRWLQDHAVQPTCVRLETTNGQIIDLCVGMQMTKQEQEDWRVSEPTVSSSPVRAPDRGCSQRRAADDIVKRLLQRREQEGGSTADPAPPATPVPAPAATERKEDASSNSEADEDLKRLLQKREQELNKMKKTQNTRWTLSRLGALAMMVALSFRPAVGQETKPADPAAVPAPAPVPAPAAPTTADVTPAAPEERGLRLNFRGVPLDMVLSYLSDAAGFIIVFGHGGEREDRRLEQSTPEQG